MQSDSHFNFKYIARATMISPAEGAKIYLALESVDMRKSVDGLAILVAETLKQDPQSGIF